MRERSFYDWILAKPIGLTAKSQATGRPHSPLVREISRLIATRRAPVYRDVPGEMPTVDNVPKQRACHDRLLTYGMPQPSNYAVAEKEDVKELNRGVSRGVRNYIPELKEVLVAPSKPTTGTPGRTVVPVYVTVGHSGLGCVLDRCDRTVLRVVPQQAAEPKAL